MNHPVRSLWLKLLLITLVAPACSGGGGSCPHTDCDTKCTEPSPDGDGGDSLSDVVAPDSGDLDQAPGDVEMVDAIQDILAGDAPSDAAADLSYDAELLPDTEQPPDLPAWTLMVYMNGDNNLSTDALNDLEEMGAALWSEQIQVVVLVDTLFEGAEELRLGPDGFETLDSLGEIDMSDWTELRDFGVRTVEAIPSQRYALILWDHGGGWTKPSAPGQKGLSNDDTGVYQEISVAAGELTAALEPVVEAAGGPLDLLGFDMCLMGMWEVAVAVEGTAQVMIASQETEPADGWNYAGILSFLSGEPGMEAAALAELITILYYTGDLDNCTLAATALGGIPAVTAALGTLGEVLLADPALFPEIEQARKKSQWFDDDLTKKSSPTRDLRDLTDLLDAELPPAPALQAATAAVRDALDAAVLINLAQTTHPRAHGLSIHFPSRDLYFPPAYLDEIAPWSACPWTGFVDAFSTAIDPSWTCSGSYFGTDDGCDCGCGSWDPDCDEDPEVYGCSGDEICVLPGLCQDLEGPCLEGIVQCSGDKEIATCQDGAWILTPCVELVTCAVSGPFGAAVCGWMEEEETYACTCFDDPALCAGVECGDNGLGQWCGDCDAGWVCLDGTCLEKGECPGMEILDCDGECGDSDWLGDGECDDGGWDVDFNCEALDFDGGDCEPDA